MAMKCQNVKNCGHLVLDNSARLNKEHVWELDYALFRNRMLLHSLGYVLLDRRWLPHLFISSSLSNSTQYCTVFPLYYTLALTRSVDYCTTLLFAGKILLDHSNSELPSAQIFRKHERSRLHRHCHCDSAPHHYTSNWPVSA